MIGKMIGFSLRKDFQRAVARIKAWARPGHSPVARCLNVPCSPEHPGTLHEPDESPDQCLRSQQVRYLPLSILACTVAFRTSYGELPAEVHIGWGLDRDMKFARNSDNEGNSSTDVLALSSIFHQSITCCLTRRLKLSFEEGFSR